MTRGSGGVRTKHGVPEPASMAEIEQVATILLGNILTSMDAAELVLNRRVDGKERMIAQIISSRMSPAEKFGLLLMEAGVEKSMTEQGITDFGTRESLFKK